MVPIFPVMTPAQLKAALRRLKWSAPRAAESLGVTPRTVRRWLTGARRIPKTVELLLATIEGRKP